MAPRSALDLLMDFWELLLNSLVKLSDNGAHGLVRMDTRNHLPGDQAGRARGYCCGHWLASWLVWGSPEKKAGI